MGKNNTVQLLTWILGAWIMSWGLTFAAPAYIHPSSLESATKCAHHALALALFAPLPNALGGEDHESVLDEQDPPEADAPTLSDLDDTQAPPSVGDVQYQRAAFSARSTHLGSLYLVEPRFLRYSRLLN